MKPPSNVLPISSLNTPSQNIIMGIEEHKAAPIQNTDLSLSGISESNFGDNNSKSIHNK